MTKYHNIEEETAANLDEWQTSISNITSFKQFKSTLPTTPSTGLRLLYFANQYVLITASRYYYVSTNLTEWERRDNGLGNVNDAFTTSTALFIKHSTKYIAATTDLTTWRDASHSASYLFGSHYVCSMEPTTSEHKIITLHTTSKNVNIITLPNNFGNSWTYTRTSSNNFRSYTTDTTEIVWAGDRYLFAEKTNPSCYYSLDGINWIEVILPFTVDSGVNAITSVAGTTGKYYIIGNNSGSIYYTPDFRTWSQVIIEGSHYDYRPLMFYHKTMKEMVGIHGQKDLWFQENISSKFSLIGPSRDIETDSYSWVDICYDGEKYIAWYVNTTTANIYFATISDSYKDTNLSYALSMILQKIDETNSKLQELIDLQQ